MNSSLLFLTLLTLLFVSNPSSSSSSTQVFEAWCKEYGKSYSSELEELYRRSVFEQNLALITQHNEMAFSYTLSLNSFSDMTQNEFRASRLGFRPIFLTIEHNAEKKSSVASDVPSSMDWREKGAVTSVKDQGDCGSSWAFSAIGAIEGINKIVTGSLISLSEQELMDCNKGLTTRGCSGGQVASAFQFVMKNKGIDTDMDYPYQAWDMDCNQEKVNRRVVTIDSFKYVPLYDEEQLLQAVARQPVSASIAASSFAFQFYSKGIVTGSCSTLLDHAVLIVGYGSENGVDYWILKNSWGKRWGMDGYMYLQRDHGNRKGLCGINMFALYPIKTGANPPPPGPVNCDSNGGETCCCWMWFRGTCRSWTCCDNFGVCCEDLIHCCPPEYPICDTERKLCLQAYGNLTMKVHESRSSARKLGTSNVARKLGTGSVAGKSWQPRLQPFFIGDWPIPIPPSPVQVILTNNVSYFLPGNNSSADRSKSIQF
ncbi:cysteine proteinase COT44-like [Rosa rugosa]|uniref:cysteine proteinase COT44-like n=1 Tax=Rosa rugosa TaxID=74645 RepID=UPI002B405451|nr:cysteine proteinase COT44-like [Rosa rugosa]